MGAAVGLLPQGLHPGRLERPARHGVGSVAQAGRGRARQRLQLGRQALAAARPGTSTFAYSSIDEVGGKRVADLLVLEQLGARVHPLVRVERLLVRPAGQDREEPEEGREDQQPGDEPPARATGRGVTRAHRRTFAPAVRHVNEACTRLGEGVRSPPSPRRAPGRGPPRPAPGVRAAARTRVRARRGGQAAGSGSSRGRACPSGSESRSGAAASAWRAPRAQGRGARRRGLGPQPQTGTSATSRPDPRWAISSKRSVSPRNAILCLSVDDIADRQRLASEGQALRGVVRRNRADLQRADADRLPDVHFVDPAESVPAQDGPATPRGDDVGASPDAPQRPEVEVVLVGVRDQHRIDRPDRRRRSRVSPQVEHALHQQRVRQHAAAVHLDEHRRMADPRDLGGR